MFARALVFLLVVLNLGVALWWLTRADASTPVRAEAIPPGVARLQLASESPATTASGTAPVPSELEPEAPVAAAAPAPERCFAFGPFENASAAGNARNGLPGTVLRSRLRETAAAARAWQVALPAQADRAAATAMAERIRQAGFTDLYVVPEGAGANSISLGRFGNEASARAHAGALRNAGFEATVTPSGGEAAHWLDVAVAGTFDPTSIQRTAGARRIEDIACDRVP